jgi:hypothetical protein
MESLADNRLYARDYNTDYVSTFNKKRGRRKIKDEGKENRKREREDSLLRCLHAPR